MEWYENDLTKALNIKYPIIQAPMASAASVELAAAVSNAGGLGSLGLSYHKIENILPDYKKITPFLKKYVEYMGWDDLNWLEDVHMGYESGKPAVFDRNVNGWVTTPKNMKLPKDQQDRDMIARELLIKFQMSPKHPLVQLKKAYKKFD